MTERKPPDPALQSIVDAATPEALQQLALRDALLELIQVSIGGVPLRPRPALPDELEKKKPGQE